MSAVSLSKGVGAVITCAQQKPNNGLSVRRSNETDASAARNRVRLKITEKHEICWARWSLQLLRARGLSRKVTGCWSATRHWALDAVRAS